MRSWAALRAILGRSWVALGGSWAVLGCSWGLLGRSWAVIGGVGGQKVHFMKKCSWWGRGHDFDGLGWLLAALGSLLGGLGWLLAALESLLGRSWQLLPRQVDFHRDLQGSGVAASKR